MRLQFINAKFEGNFDAIKKKLNDLEQARRNKFVFQLTLWKPKNSAVNSANYAFESGQVYLFRRVRGLRLYYNLTEGSCPIQTVEDSLPPISDNQSPISNRSATLTNEYCISPMQSNDEIENSLSENLETTVESTKHAHDDNKSSPMKKAKILNPGCRHGQVVRKRLAKRLHLDLDIPITSDGCVMAHKGLLKDFGLLESVGKVIRVVRNRAREVGNVVGVLIVRADIQQKIGRIASKRTLEAKAFEMRQCQFALALEHDVSVVPNQDVIEESKQATAAAVRSQPL